MCRWKRSCTLSGVAEGKFAIGFASANGPKWTSGRALQMTAQFLVGNTIVGTQEQFTRLVTTQFGMLAVDCVDFECTTKQQRWSNLE